MKTLLITGATGFVGRHLVEKAIEQNFNVIVAARPNSEVIWIKSLNIPVLILTLSNKEILSEELKDLQNNYGTIDIIIHNAGLTQGLNNCSYNEVNYTLTKNLIGCIESSFTILPKFIYTSSLASIGPGDEAEFQPIIENQQPKPVTLYGKSKLKAENFIKKQDKLDWIILRPTAVYGPYEKNLLTLIKTINKGFEVYIGSKKQMLSFIYVEDLAEAILSLANSKIYQQIYNISDGQSYSIPTVNSIIKSQLKKKTISIVLPITLIKTIAFIMEVIGSITKRATILNRNKVNELKALNWVCDISKIKNDLGFSPNYDLSKGMKKTIEWYKKNEWI